MKHLKKSKAEKGLPPLSLTHRRFNKGERVVVVPYSYDLRHLPNHRFFGKIGVIDKVGRLYTVKVADKTINVVAAHLRPA